jgi:hypothetical protein
MTKKYHEKALSLSLSLSPEENGFHILITSDLTLFLVNPHNLQFFFFFFFCSLVFVLIHNYCYLCYLLKFNLFLKSTTGGKLV